MVLKKVILSHWLFILILLAATLLRFWRLEYLTTFSGDQGYDFLIVKRMLLDGKFTLLGPKIGPYNEIGNLYLGPAYYYLLAPFLLIFNFDPIGPAVLTVLLALGTILMIYIISTKFITRPVAILAASLYAFNVFLINQSRSPSNPHLMPFFATLVIFSVLQVITSKSKLIIWPLICGICLGIMFQLHYLAASFIFAVFFIFTLTQKIKKLIPVTLAFFIAVSPQILFELRHNFFITGEFLKQIKSGQNISFLGRFIDHFSDSLGMLWSILVMTDKFVQAGVIFTLVAITIFVFKKPNARKTLGLLFLTITLTLLFVSLYAGAIGSHYFASIYVSLIIVEAVALATFIGLAKNYFAKTIIVLVILQIFAVNLLNLKLDNVEGYTMPAGWNLKGIKYVARIISQDANPSNKFNIAATLDGDTRARPYRYLVEVYGKIPQDVEEYPNSDVIYLISRDDPSVIKDYTVWEIASFVPFEITKTWDIQNGIKLYKLSKSDNL